MKLRTKFAMLVSFFIIIWIFVMAGISYNIAMRGFYKLEDNSFDRNIHQVKSAFTRLENYHSDLLSDWSARDEIYSFIDSPWSGFIENYIKKSTLDDLHMDYVLIYDENLELVGMQNSVGIEQYSHPQIRKINDVIRQHQSTSGIMLHDGKPLFFNSEKLTNGVRTATEKGLLCFAFYLNRDDIKEMAYDLDLEVSLISTSEKVTNNQERVQVYDHGKYKTALFRYPYVNDPHGIALQLTHPLSIIGQGHETITDALWLSIFSFLLLLAIMATLVGHSVRRVRQLSHEVAHLAYDKALDKRLSVVDQDEISDLTLNINHMLDRIQLMNEQLVEYATVDILTGVDNRRVGFEILSYEIGQSRINKTPLTICYIDINNLKFVNDHLGHLMGDDLIITVSEVIKKVIRKTDSVCRLGGDEFLVIFPGCEEEQAKRVMERVVQMLGEISASGEKEYPISISKGVVEYDGDMTAVDFLAMADQVMYEDKKRNKKKHDRTKDIL